MDVVILAAKSMIAVMLLIAGGAKLADLSGFAATMRLFMPRQPGKRVMRAFACTVAIGELVLGTASLCWPVARWLNTLVFAVACLFAVITSVGYAFYRGRTCRCFGALSQRKFDLLGVLRSIAIAAIALVAMFGVPPATLQLGVPERVLLALSAIFVALAALTAASALGTTSRSESRMTIT
jgi:Methylamine utilisation protein MauE